MPHTVKPFRDRIMRSAFQAQVWADAGLDELKRREPIISGAAGK
jgi:hypothetical protein